jgi:signal peptidase II
MQNTSRRTALQQLGFVVGAAILVLVSDQVTKACIRRFVAYGESLSVIPGCFNITHRLNQGIAFSFFSNVNAAPYIFSAVAVLAVIFIGWLAYRHTDLPVKVILALGLVAGGALGNMIDRILPPHKVLDFVDWYVGNYHWPAFNIADSAICVGAALLVLAAFTDPQAFSRQKTSSSEPAP